ncbi:MAG: SRPBCC family protein [Vampirovibrionales bacterium]|nr:SRPBCC family protein [Vampirovibrionales bacterium]
MTTYRLHRTQRLPITQDVAWAFFSNPHNLEEITPPWLRFEITSAMPKLMYPGMIATYDLKFYNLIPLSWVTEITHVIAPHYFVDEQRFGPYQFWHHQHHFEPIIDPDSGNEIGVEMTDTVHYRLPFGIFGAIAHGLMVEHQLRDIFDYRVKMLTEFFGEL